MTQIHLLFATLSQKRHIDDTRVGRHSRSLTKEFEKASQADTYGHNSSGSFKKSVSDF